MAAAVREENKESQETINNGGSAIDIDDDPKIKKRPAKYSQK